MSDNFDVFNGDADGICALHQFRLAYPVRAELVSGVKRDIKLLEKVQARSGDRVSVFNISMAANRPSLPNLLNLGVHVIYFDHHLVGTLTSILI